MISDAGRPRFRSLKVRLLVPLIGTSLVTAVVVAVISAALGNWWGRTSVEEQFRRIEKTLTESNFPLTSPVLELLAELTQSEMIALGEDGKVINSTLDGTEVVQLQTAWGRASNSHQENKALAFELEGKKFLGYVFQRKFSGDKGLDATHELVVLFDEQRIRDLSFRMALLPLITALSTIAVISAFAFYLSNRWIVRINQLQGRVQKLSSGDFQEQQRTGLVEDEVDELGVAIEGMAKELKNLWGVLRVQQSQKVLHQLAGGIAHQLRNTLTGARMALELFKRRQVDEHEELRVALLELQQAEEYIKRLLVVGKGERTDGSPTKVEECLRSVKDCTVLMAKHLNVSLTWKTDPALDGKWVSDGATCSAALSNLVINAIQSGQTVVVDAELTGNGMIGFTVRDDGPGVDPRIQDDLFEPLVTTKPEGAGLGLALVKKAAEYMGGKVSWRRDNDMTEFTFIVPTRDG